MRLRDISSITEANKFLPEFIADYNSKFAVTSKKTNNMHVPITYDEDKLNYILSVRENRVLSKNLECSFNNMCIQITTKTKGYRLRKATVTIAMNTDGEITVWHQKEKLQFTIKNTQLRTRVVDYKEISLNSPFNLTLAKDFLNLPRRQEKIIISP